MSKISKKYTNITFLSSDDYELTVKLNNKKFKSPFKSNKNVTLYINKPHIDLPN